jgi:hypothetical protein
MHVSPIRPVQRCLEQAPCDTGYLIGTAQVTGLLDLSPSSVPSCDVHERSTAGTSQVRKRSAETGAATANREPVHPWPVAFCRPSGPRWRGLLSWRGRPHEAPRRQPARFRPRPRRCPVPAGFSRRRRSRGPCGPDRRPASDLLELAGTAGDRDAGASGSVNRTFRLLARAIRPPEPAHDRGRCPLYVRILMEAVDGTPSAVCFARSSGPR